MDFDAIRRVACWKKPSKKPEPPTPAAVPPPAPAPAPAPPPPPPGPPQGFSGPPPTGHYIEMFQNFPGDPRSRYLEHSRSWKLGFNPNYNDNCSCQDYQGHIPGYEATSGWRRRPQFALPPPGPRFALPPPDIYMDGHNHGYYDQDHHHWHGESSRGYYYGGNPRSPPAREFGPGSFGPPAREFGPGSFGPPPLLGPPPPEYHYHYPGDAQYYLPSTNGNYFSDENPNGCSIM